MLDPSAHRDSFTRDHLPPPAQWPLFDKSGNSAMRVGRVWARSLLRIAGVRVTIEGLEKIDLTRSYVICSNHLSYMDTPVVLSSIPVQFRFLAKKGLFQIPFLGTHLFDFHH